MIHLEAEIQKAIESHRFNFSHGQQDTVLELLRYSYFECSPIEDEAIRRAWAELDSVLDALPMEESDALLYMVSGIIDAYVRAAFRHGAMLGGKIEKELAEKTLCVRRGG